jgi:hypothetical protein
MTTNAEKSKVSTLFPFAIPFLDTGVARVLAGSLEQWLRLQADMLKTSEPILSGWLARQRQTSEAAIKALERLSQCHDYTEATAIQRGFFDEQMQRWGSDAKAMTDQILAISQSTVAAARQAAEMTADTAKMPASVGEQKQDVAKAAE